MSIFYFLITTILTSFFFFRKKRQAKNDKKVKYILYFLIYIIIFLSLLTLSYFINTKGEKLINRVCNNRCIYYYTNNNIKIILALIINSFSNILFYILTKKTIINIYNSKFKYIVHITYILINYSGMLFSLLTFYGVVGIFVIKNPIIFFMRIICTWLPIIIYPADTFIISRIRKKNR